MNSMISGEGVKNITKEVQELVFDGQRIVFKPGEIKILASDAAKHAEMRLRAEDQKGIVVGHRLFSRMSLAEALKAGAELEENPEIVAAKDELARKEAEKKAMRDEVIAELKAQGLLKASKEK